MTMKARRIIKTRSRERDARTRNVLRRRRRLVGVTTTTGFSDATHRKKCDERARTETRRLMVRKTGTGTTGRGFPSRRYSRDPADICSARSTGNRKRAQRAHRRGWCARLNIKQTSELCDGERRRGRRVRNTFSAFARSMIDTIPTVCKAGGTVSIRIQRAVGLNLATSSSFLSTRALEFLWYTRGDNLEMYLHVVHKLLP